MPTLKQLKEQGNALFNKQTDVVMDDRSWSEKRDEYDRIQQDINAVMEQYKAQENVEGPNPFETQDVTPVETRPQSIGEQVISSEAYKNVANKRGSRFSSGTIEVKTADLTGGAGGAGALQPTYLPGVTPILFQRLTVADLMPSGTTAGRSIIYMKESTVTNAASSVSEGGLKPASDLNITQVTENYTTIATTLKISDEMLEDAPFIASYVNGRLVLFVQITEEAQLLRANGVAPEFTGLLNRTGKQTDTAKGGDTGPDAIYKAITKVRVNAFVEPSGIVMHPNDWQDIRLAKDQNLQYYAGGPFTGAYGNGTPVNDAGNTAPGASLWGLPVVVTTAMTENSALVGAFNTCAQVFRKGGINVEMTNSNEADFLHDLVAVRAQERVALAVYRPGGFGVVTGL